MIIENASLADTDRVIELECILENTELGYARCKEIFEAQLVNPSFCCLVARETPGAPAAGLINIRFEDQLHHAARVAGILELVVDPACRGSRIGQELFRVGCEAARKAG